MDQTKSNAFYKQKNFTEMSSQRFDVQEKFTAGVGLIKQVPPVQIDSDLVPEQFKGSLISGERPEAYDSILTPHCFCL